MFATYYFFTAKQSWALVETAKFPSIAIMGSGLSLLCHHLNAAPTAAPHSSELHAARLLACGGAASILLFSSVSMLLHARPWHSGQGGDMSPGLLARLRMVFYVQFAARVLAGFVVVRLGTLSLDALGTERLLWLLVIVCFALVALGFTEHFVEQHQQESQYTEALRAGESGATGGDEVAEQDAGAAKPKELSPGLTLREQCAAQLEGLDEASLKHLLAMMAAGAFADGRHGWVHRRRRSSVHTTTPGGGPA